MSSTTRLLASAALVGVGLAAGCADTEFEPPDREAQVAEAESLYLAARFDTITWGSDRERLLVGSSIYASECRDCHGTLGQGDTEYAAEHGLDVPSLVEPDWAYAADLDGTRRRIFVGHPDGMDTWGVAGIGNREIDAAAHYVLEQLRPDALGTEGPQDGGGPGA